MKKWLLFIILIILISGGGYWAFQKYQAYTADDFTESKEKLILVGQREISVIPLIASQIEGLAQGQYYVALADLERHLRLYGDYDPALQKLRLLKDGHWIEIDAAGATVDGQTFTAIPIIASGELVLVPLNGLEEALGLSLIGNAELKSFMVVDNGASYGLLENHDTLDFYRDAGLAKRRFVKPEGSLLEIGTEGSSVLYVSPKLVHYYGEAATLEGAVYKDEIRYTDHLRFKEGTPIYLFWEYVGSKHPDTSKIPDLAGANVSSPTWMKLLTGEGEIQLNYSDAYVQWAKTKDIAVWPLITNDFDPDKTSILLNSMENRDAFVERLLGFISDKGLNAVNIDFENMHLRDQDQFTQLMAELVYRAHEQDIIVSIDVTVPDGSDNWSKVFDRQRLGELVDYMMVMTYDQYWASSPISGTVSGITWMEDNIQKMLKVVPKEKLVLGLPLYTRVWKETLSTSEANAMVAKSTAITMVRAQEIIVEKALNPIWDPINGQNFVHYFDGETIVKIWIEDLKSLQLKAQLAHQYDLAGVACWRRGFELPEAWKTIGDAMKGN